MGEWVVVADGRQHGGGIGARLGLHAAVPVVPCDTGISFDHIAVHVGFPEMIEHGLAALRFGFQESPGYGPADGRCGAGLQVVVDDIEKTPVVAAVHGAMNPVVEHIVHEREVAVHSDTGIATGVVRPEIAMKCAVETADGAAEGVMVGVQAFAEDRVLDSDIDRGQLELRSSRGRLVHVAVHRHVFVEPPRCRYVVDHDVADGISPEGVISVANPGLTPAETHVTDDDVVCFKFDGVARNAHAVAWRGAAGERDVGRTHADAALEPDDS